MDAIQYPGVNAEAICDCGARQWRVGIEVSAQHAGMISNSANHIRVLQCIPCGHQLSIPFTQGT